MSALDHAEDDDIDWPDDPEEEEEESDTDEPLTTGQAREAARVVLDNLETRAARMNSEYDRFGTDNTAKSVDPQAYALAKFVQFLFGA